MADIEVDQAEAQDKSPLDFYEDFDTKQPGDVILQAGDEKAKCFYFRLSLLGALSSFFANLPSPSPADMVDGTPLIPLHDTTSYGLAVYLLAVKSTSTFDAYDFSRSEEPWPAILQAAAIAKLYDTPLVCRLLIEGIPGGIRVPHRPYLEFAILAISGADHQLPMAAKRTLLFGNGDITAINSFITNMCCLHVPIQWMKLQSLHLRYIQTPRAFRKLLDDTKDTILPFDSHNQASGRLCTDGQQGAAEVRRRLYGANDPSEIMAIKDEGYGLSCTGCRRMAQLRYGVMINQITDFAHDYNYKEEHCED